MVRIIVVGGGLAGCAAASAAAKAGASVTLLERTEVLGGCGLWSGALDKKCLPVREELRFMSGDDIFAVLETCTLHDNVKFPWPKPSGAVKRLFDVTRVDGALLKHLKKVGVEVRLPSRAKDVKMDGKCIRSVILDDETCLEGDAFVDATGGAGGFENCQKYGNGCAMCFMRCPAFGDRVSIVQKAGVKELAGKKGDGSIGPMSAACTLLKETMAPELRKELETTGRAFIALPQELIHYKRTESITASVNIDAGFAENVVLADIGAYAKRIAAGYAPLHELRRVPGLENVRYIDPYAGTIGNAIRFMAVSPRDNALQVPGIENLFVASEKLGVSGIPTAIMTGVLAGHNSLRMAVGMTPLVVSRNTIFGDFFAYVNERWDKEEGLRKRFNTFHGPYLKRTEELGLYTEDKTILRSRIEENDLVNVFAKRLH